MNDNLRQQLEALFIEAGTAHHCAFIHVNGEDDAWALWYANYLCERLGILLQRRFHPTELSEVLEKLDAERKALAIGNWATYYAEFFVRQFAAVTSS